MPKGQENQFWQSIFKAGAEAACAENNNECKMLFVAPNPENDVVQQVNIVNTQVNNKVAGIVLAACDKTALVAPVKAAMAAGIPVVTIDLGISTDMTPSPTSLRTMSKAGKLLPTSWPN